MFRLGSARPLSKLCNNLNVLPLRRFVSSGSGKFNNFQIGSSLLGRGGNKSLLLGVSSSILLSNFLSHSLLIKNDSGVLTNTRNHFEAETSRLVNENKPKYNGAFGGKLNYSELSIGSITGLALGVLAKLISPLLWYLTLSGYLLIRFLNNRGIITLNFNQFITFGSSRINVRKMVFERPSFNITFILTFIIAAY
ncbi:hypothetical protein PACTADRAFT_50797, partial [Pachysolen tannophilus NRRL Y-2460]